jgi:hypothetical protein
VTSRQLDVLVFTASGTFWGARGRVVEQRADGACWVVLETGERMLFSRSEIVPASDDAGKHHGGAE